MFPSKLLPFILLFLFLGCKKQPAKEEQENVVSNYATFPEIQERGKLIVTTLYSSTSYFQYKMQPMGYEYEMIHDFATSQGLELELKVAANGRQMMEMLENGDVDVIAYPVLINNTNRQQYRFCGIEEQSCQVLVQRANKGDQRLKDVTELIGKTITIKKNSRYQKRLENLNVELGGGIDIRLIENDSITSEDLINMVSKGEISYTICDENIARLNKTYYWNIDASLKVSFMQRSSWLVNLGNESLAHAIDQWASDKNRKRSFSKIIKRYYEWGKRPESQAESIPSGHLSPYDALFQKHAAVIGWDWRLLAAIAYQESRFNPNLVSWAGAEGLMGIMPNTAKALGISPHELQDPDTGIRTGVDCLRHFRQGFSSIEDPEEKIKFTLAAYNAGIGHIYDAQRLAEKYGKDPQKWDHHVADFVRLKSDPEYYNDPVCRHGYLRGSETFNYVQEVMRRFEQYKLNP